MKQHNQPFIKAKERTNSFFRFYKNSSNITKLMLLGFIGILAINNAAAEQNYVYFLSPSNINLSVKSNGEAMITKRETLTSFTHEATSMPEKGRNKLTLLVESSRKKSSAVAEALNNRVNQTGKLIAKTGGTNPKELNFYVGYTLSINDSPVLGDFYIAQGSYGLLGINKNNWWAASNHDANPKPNGSDCYITVTTDKNDNVYYYITAKSDNTFEVSTEIPTCGTTTSNPLGPAAT